MPSDPASPADPGDSAGRSPPDLEAARIADEYLDRLQRGEAPDRAALLGAHPELAERLKRRLGVLEKLFHAHRRDSLDAGSSLPGDELPERIGRFEVIAVLGRGACGTVYKALDATLSRAVAVKVPRAEWYSSPEQEERFLREARSAAQLQHPGIVPVFETGHDGGVPYIVSELIESRTLAELIAGDRPELARSASIIAEAADALDFAHARRVIHRDVKPQNILMDAEGRPHVSDFGLARSEVEDVTVTLDGEIIGTPAYMSPEQASGDHARVGASSDVYGLGVVLYELLTGERPFRGSRSRVIHQVLHDDPRPPRSLNDQIPRDLETICLKAMAKEPWKRYPTAAGLAADLRRWLRGEPIDARPVGRLEKSVRWARRNKLAALLLASVAVLLVVTAVSSTVAYFRVQGSLARTKLAEEKATSAFETSRSLLVERQLAAGAESLRQGDYLGALAWFVEARRHDSDDPRARALHDARLAALFQYCPRIESIWFTDKRGLWKAFSSDLGRVLLVSTRHLTVFETPTGAVLHEEGGDRLVPEAAISKDGRWLAAATSEGPAALRDLDAPGSAAAFAGKGSCDAVAFSHDGKLLAVASRDGELEIWSVQDRERRAGPVDVEKAPHRLEFSADGTAILAASRPDRVSLWRLADGRLAGPILQERLPLHTSALSSDGQRVALGTMGGLTRLVSAAGAGRVEVRPAHAAGVGSLAFGRSDSLVLTGSTDRTAQAWHAATAEPAGPPLAHDGSVHVARFNRDGSRVITGANDGVVRFWDPLTGKEAAPRLWHAGWVQAVQLGGDETRLATASVDGGVRVWRLGAPPRERLVIDTGGPCLDGTILDGGRKLLTYSHRVGARIWDLQTGTPATPVLEESAEASMVRAGAGGAIVWGTSDRGALRFWDGLTGELRGSWPALKEPIGQFAVSRDGKRLALGTTRGAIALWGKTAGWRSVIQGSQVLFLGFSADGRRLISTGSLGGDVNVWDADSGDRLAALDHHGNRGATAAMAVVSVAAFFANDTKVVTADVFGSLKVWDTATGALEGSVDTCHASLWRGVLDEPRGRLATMGEDGDVRLWSLGDTTPLGPPFQQEGGLSVAAFSPDGLTLATGGSDGLVRLWDVASSKPLRPPFPHGGPITAVHFLDGGAEVVACSRDGTVKVWQVRGGSALPAHFEALARLHSCRGPDGRGGLQMLSPRELRRVREELAPAARN